MTVCLMDVCGRLCIVNLVQVLWNILITKGLIEDMAVV